MITRIVKLTIKPEEIANFRKNFDVVKTQIVSFNGCTHLELLEEVSKKGVYFTYSIWNSESDLEVYLRSGLFSATWQSVKPLFAAKAEAWSTSSVELLQMNNIKKV